MTSLGIRIGCGNDGTHKGGGRWDMERGSPIRLDRVWTLRPLKFPSYADWGLLLPTQKGATRVPRHAGACSRRLREARGRAVDEWVSRRWVKYSMSCASEIVDAVIEVGADTADGAGIGLDGLGLEPLELEVFEVGLVQSVEVRRGCWSHGRVAPRFWLEHPLRDEGGEATF